MQPSNAELRAGAVAKLKRAASLPRIKGGRRPPMHPLGSSEGEKNKDDAGSSKQGDDSKEVTSDEREEPEKTEPSETSYRAEEDMERIPEHVQPESHDHSGQRKGSVHLNGDDEHNLQPFSPSPPPTPTKRKRRSRSRSHSHSKDFKPSKTPPPGDSSPEDKAAFLPSFDDIPVASPIPSHPSPFQVGALFPFIPPTAPSTPAPSGGVPSLQDLQQRFGAGLLRSQSASRAATMMKLTGGIASTLEPPPPSPSPGISRNNTVTGSERRAARQIMMGKLQNRTGGQNDEPATSGGEEIIPAPKKKRRRSRKPSESATSPKPPDVVDDRETADTPSIQLAFLPSPQYPEFEAVRQLSPASQMQELLSTSIQTSAPPSPPEDDLPELPEHPIPKPANLPQYAFQLGDIPGQKHDVATPKRKHDDVVIEEDDAVSDIPLPLHSPTHSHRTSLHEQVHHLRTNGRALHSSDTPSWVSADVPVMMSDDMLPSPYEQDVFPQSPFNTPCKERLRGEEEEEEEEEIVYEKATNGTVNINTNSNGIQWPTQHSDTENTPAVLNDDDEEDVPPETPGTLDYAVQHPRTTSPSPSPIPADPIYPVNPSYPSDSSFGVSHGSMARESASSLEPSPGLGNFPNTTGVLRRDSYTDIGTDYEDTQTDKETAKDKFGWKRSLRTLVRNASMSGRRSRANSTTKRDEKAANRESGASGTSGKVDQVKYTDTAPPSAWNSPNQPYTQLTQDPPRSQPAASVSMLSFSPVTPHRGGQSPIPPASPADRSRYGANDKLNPFPGLFVLDEQRRKQRSRQLSVSMSSPNLPHDIVDAGADTSHTDGDTDVEKDKRERKLSHQYSDSGLLRYRHAAEAESASQIAPQPAKLSSSSWLPMTRNDLRKWYRVNNKTPPKASQPSLPVISTTMISSPILSGTEIPSRSVSRTGSRPGSSQQKRLDILSTNGENSGDYEDGVSNPASTPKNKAQGRLDHHDTMDLPHDPFASPPGATRIQSQQISISSSEGSFRRDAETDGEGLISRRRPTRPPLSIIAEPVGMDRSRTPSAATQTDSSMSVPSLGLPESPDVPTHPQERSSVVLQRLELVLSRTVHDPDVTTFLDDPPRKMILSSSVTQIVDSESIKDRFLFLFNDILVVAKPFEPRLFLVKNIIDLDDIQVLSNRRMSSIGMQHPVVQRFISDFNQHADQAVTNLLQETALDDDQTSLGKLLFNTVELDRTRLGAYLSKKSRRDVLKSYIDCFGFTGVRIDQALRTFVLTLRLPIDAPEYTRQHLLDTFAAKWFEVNSQMVTYGKDVALKLVRLLVHFDELFPKYNILRQNDYHSHQQELYSAWERMFRQVDRASVSDEVVQEMYFCLQKDPLRWASDIPYQRLTHITFKRPPPNHLVLRTNSDPISLRIAQPDPDLRILLLSQDGLVFDPPELTFARSTEVVFRATGTTLGPKSIIFSFRGPRAHLYQGITVSKTVMVERSFMRNTFQIAFKDKSILRRRYMFSTEDAVICNQFMMNLKPHHARLSDNTEIQKAAKALSLAVLRETFTEKVSATDLILICKQNSLIPRVLSSVTSHS